METTTTALDQVSKALRAAGYDNRLGTLDESLVIDDAAPDSGGRSTEPGSEWDEECDAILTEVQAIVRPHGCTAEWVDDDIHVTADGDDSEPAWSVGDRVEAGDIADDHDAGTVLAVGGAKIQSGGPVGHVGTEDWAVRTICQFSSLDIDPAEVVILRAHKSGGSPTGMRWVVSGGAIVGTYTLDSPTGDEEDCDR